MKLSEIKIGLIEHFFDDSCDGIAEDQLDPVLESICGHARLTLPEGTLSEILRHGTNQSNDPSKAFKRFTDGRAAILTIMEEEGLRSNAIFVAVRSGRQVIVADLTKTPIIERAGELISVKHALRQAKNLNEDSFFNIAVITDLLKDYS